MLELIGIAKNGRWILPLNEEHLYTQLLKDCEGKFVKGRFSKVGRNKTWKQCKTHFGLLLNAVIAEANERGTDTSEFLKLMVRDDLPTGVGLTKGFLHELLYALCPTYDEKGRRITLKTMTTDQASDWYERCQNLLSSRGYYVADPDPNWKEQRG